MLSPTRCPLSLLIVDDEEHVCAVTKLMVEVAGHKAATVMEGHAALRELAARPYNAVVIDMLMLEMDGVELRNELRHQHTPLRFIAMSGGGRIPKEGCRPIALMSGPHALLPKPFSREPLERALTPDFGKI